MERTAWVFMAAFALAVGGPAWNARAGTSAPTGPDNVPWPSTAPEGADPQAMLDVKETTAEPAATPIVVEGAEATAFRRAATPPGDTVELGVGPLRAALLGFPESAVVAGTRVHRGGDDLLEEGSDVFWGAGMNLLMGRRGDLHLEGGRVTLREPLDVLTWGASKSDYGMTWAGLEIRF